MELVAALCGASALAAGMASALFVALKATDTSGSPAAVALDGHACLVEMAAEVEYATTTTEQAATAITLTVPDRDSDAISETIRYAWTGTAGDPLTRQYNSGSEANAVDDVHDFAIEYYQPASNLEYLTVRLQVSSDSRTRVDTAIPLVNRP